MATCKICAQENVSDGGFCIGCGAPIGPQWEAIERVINERLENAIRAQLKAEFADQKTLEIETTERIAERALRWAKTFGFFIGIPVAMIIALLGAVGLRTWSDVTVAREKIASVASGLDAALTQLNSATKQAGDVLSDAKSFRVKLQEASDQLAAIPGLQQRQRALEEKFRSFVYKGSANEDVKKIDETVEKYKKYLVSLGLDLPPNLPEFEIIPTFDKNNMFSYYDITNNSVVVIEEAKDDPSVWLRDFTHQILFNQVEPDKRENKVNHAAIFDQIFSIESVISSYLPCSFLENPKVGENLGKRLGMPYLINLDQKLDFDIYKTTPRTRNAFYKQSEIVGSIFWDIRKNMERAEADRILISSWFEFLRTASKFDIIDFIRIYRGQFDTGEMARYKGDVDTVLREHNVQL